MLVKLEELYHLIPKLMTSDLSKGHRVNIKKKTAVAYLRDYPSEWNQIWCDYSLLSTNYTETSFFHIGRITRAVTPFLRLRQKTLTLGFFRTLWEQFLSNLVGIYPASAFTILPNMIDL